MNNVFNFLYLISKIIKDETSLLSERKLKLHNSGFDDKMVEFKADDEGEDVLTKIQAVYPQLASRGGYEYMRVDKSKRKLLEIPPSINGFTAEYLKTTINNGKLYLRPIQRSLDLDKGIVNLEKMTMHECLSCHNQFYLHQLKLQKNKKTVSQQMHHQLRLHQLLHHQHQLWLHQLFQVQHILSVEFIHNNHYQTFPPLIHWSTNDSSIEDAMGDDIQIINELPSAKGLVDVNSIHQAFWTGYDNVLEVRRENALMDFLEELLSESSSLVFKKPIIKFTLQVNIRMTKIK